MLPFYLFATKRSARSLENAPQTRFVQAPRSQAWQLVPAIGLLALLTGCISKEKIPFTDEAEVARRQAAVSAADEPKAQNLSTADESSMETAVYSYMLERDLGDTNQYTAVFLEGSDDEVARLQAKFPNHNPPIKASAQASLHPPQTPLDKDTGRPAMILSVEAGAPVDDTVDVVGHWYSTDTMTGIFHFTLKKAGTEWAIDSVK